MFQDGHFDGLFLPPCLRPDGKWGGAQQLDGHDLFPSSWHAVLGDPGIRLPPWNAVRSLNLCGAAC